MNVGVYIKQDVLTIRLKGELDEISVSDLRTRISRYIDEYKIKHLVINTEKLEFLDSSGIGFIIGRYHQLKKINGDVTLCGVNNKIERIILLSGLAKICTIRETEQSVLVALGGK
ncbi:MAG: anti-sigma factor antagonist [Acholeplasmatales bacterium]|nr:anti-sigma factor antagonist [Acholeplasmatales bacterium]